MAINNSYRFAFDKPLLNKAAAHNEAAAFNETTTHKETVALNKTTTYNEFAAFNKTATHNKVATFNEAAAYSKAAVRNEAATLNEQELANIVINYTQTCANQFSLYILEEHKGFCKFTLPLNTYCSWMKKEEAAKNINFLKFRETYKNKNGVWSEYYTCSWASTKQIHTDRIEDGVSQKKRCVQKESKKVRCKCVLQINYQSATFSNEVVVVNYWHKHNGHIPDSHADV
ncbi:1937_t:CDS:2 [Cetraspora pellucida]|uniref:1937_t:CDS:1 n=1 Tax=Cetraspora pellucida TaxID=1433469 RepID=A0A9N9G7A8_9GLOM|nr:1937_t:CDS:2 [Cetraspora pellucida]